MRNHRTWIVTLSVGALLTAALLAPAGAATQKDLKQAWKFVKSKLSAAGTINLAGNPVDWTKLKNVPAGLADGVDNTATGTCVAGSFVTGANADGSLVCAAGNAGDITGVTAGTGLSGGGTTGDVSLTANLAVVQARISTACAAGQMVQSVNQAGTPVCAVDDGSGRQVVIATDDALTTDDVAAATASCPVGKVVMGGGASTSATIVTDDDNVALRVSAPTSTGNTGWTAEAFETVSIPGNNWTLSVYAICVSAG